MTSRSIALIKQLLRQENQSSNNKFHMTSEKQPYVEGKKILQDLCMSIT